MSFLRDLALLDISLGWKLGWVGLGWFCDLVGIGWAGIDISLGFDIWLCRFGSAVLGWAGDIRFVWVGDMGVLD